MGKEHTPSIDRAFSIKYDHQPIDRSEVIMQQLEVEAQAKVAVIIEGPPIYLWPPSLPEFDSLQWRSKAFRNGWKFANTFAERLPERKSFQYILVDDLNYLPKNAENADIRNQIMRLRTSSSEIEQSALFKPQSDNVKILLESQLAADEGTTQCSKLDGAFNAKKILDQVGSGGHPLLYPGNAHKLMLAVINPDTAVVRSEQLNMMMELYKVLRKNPEFQKYSKKFASEAITETFRHVWLNENGNVKGMTKPIFQGSHFSFVGR